MAAVAGERILICADVARFFNHRIGNSVTPCARQS
jgi:hypothetical protein